MQIKNKIIIYFAYLTALLLTFSLNLHADEFDIFASEISIDKINNIVIGKGSVEVKDNQGKVIKADTFIAPNVII